MRKHVKGYLLADLAHKAGVSGQYVNMVLDNKRERKSEKAQKIIEAVTILESAIDTANKKIDKIFQK